MKRVMYHFVGLPSEYIETLMNIQRSTKETDLTFKHTKKNGIVASIYGIRSQIDERCQEIKAEKIIRSGVRSKRGHINARYWISIQPGYNSMSEAAKKWAVYNFRNLFPISR